MSRMTAIRDNLCDLGRFEIPRPRCQGMTFVATRGRQGFYKTIRENGAKYGIQLKAQGPKRPQLSSDLFSRPTTVAEESVDDLLSDNETFLSSDSKVMQNNQKNYKPSSNNFTNQEIEATRRKLNQRAGITQNIMSRTTKSQNSQKSFVQN